MDFKMGGNQPSQNTSMKKEKPIQPLALSNRCIETSAQINHVLQVMATTAASLSGYKRQMGMFGEETTPKEHPMQMSEGEIAPEKRLVGV